MSITQVAKLAGVSHATVSNVINNRPNVRADTVQTVRRVMDEIGYRPRPVKQRPGRRPKSADGVRTGSVALIWPEVDSNDNSIACGLMEGISAELHRRGLHLAPIFAGLYTSVDDFAASVAGTDGCVIHGTLPERFHEPLRSLPVVWLGSVGPLSWGDRVSCDNSQVGRDAARHLHHQGCDRVIFVNFDENHPAYVARGLWLENEAQRRGLMFDGTFACVAHEGTAPTDPNAATAQSVIDYLKQVPADESVGLFVACDRYVAMLERECRLTGFGDLTDYTLVACDHDLAALSGMSRRPATFQIQPNRIGELAIDRLADRMRHPNLTGQTTTLVPAVLVPDPD